MLFSVKLVSYATGDRHIVEIPAADQYEAFDIARRAYGEPVELPRAIPGDHVAELVECHDDYTVTEFTELDFGV